MTEMTIITLPSQFCGNGSMGKLISLVISIVNRQTHISIAKMTLPQNQASAKMNRLWLVFSDRGAKIIQFTATKPANLIQFLHILFGTSLITKH